MRMCGCGGVGRRGREGRGEPVRIFSITQSAHPRGFCATFLLASLSWSLEQTNLKQEPIGAPA